MSASITIPANPDDTAPTSPSRRRAWPRELMFLCTTYLITVFIASLFIAACGPGCCYVFYSIIAGASGVFMLRRSIPVRCICLGILLLSLFGMWHEKETRDTWGQRALHLQLQQLQQELQKAQSK